MPNDAPLVDAVALLFTYADMHGKGSSSLKSAFWNISVARRHKGGLGIGASYSATDVREELRAHAVIDCKNEPILDDEDEHEDPKAQKNIDIGEDSYVLRWYDGDSSNKKIDENTADVKISNEFGLRQRKGKDQKTKEKEWSETVYFDEEEDKLRNVDPLGERII